MPDFSGVGVAVVTPFDENQNIDFVALKKIIHYLIDGGLDFLVALGTTGETPTISDPERYAILDCFKETVNNRIPIMAGFGGNDTGHVLQAMKEYSLDGLQGILSVTPYYNKPNQRGIYQHFSAIAKESPLPMVIYNVPSRTGANIEAQTALKLGRDFENIVGIKEASGNVVQCMEILQQKTDDFLFLSGDDNITYPLMAMGGDGVISVMGNAYPSRMAKMIHSALEGKLDIALKEHFEMLKMMQLIFKDGNPAGIKAVMKLLGICEDYVRLPLVSVQHDLFEELKEEVENLKQPVKEAG